MKRISLIITAVAAILSGSSCGKIDDTTQSPLPSNNGNIPNGALPGVFSVSETKKVHFSKGNLWAELDSETLHFESYQWEYEASFYHSTNHVSYFSWSDSIHGAIYGSNGDHIFCDENHKQAVDGSDEIFYAMSITEWQYLINKDGNQNIRKDKYKYGVTVCGKTNCLVIAPDDWDITTRPLQASYDASSWKIAERAGLVCLPAAGHRFDTPYIGDDGKMGYYWSSSECYGKCAYDMQFCDDFNINVTFYNEDHKDTERSVRLVTEVKILAP